MRSSREPMGNQQATPILLALSISRLISSKPRRRAHCLSSCRQRERDNCRQRKRDNCRQRERDNCRDQRFARLRTTGGAQRRV